MLTEEQILEAIDAANEEVPGNDWELCTVTGSTVIVSAKNKPNRTMRVLSTTLGPAVKDPGFAEMDIAVKRFDDFFSRCISKENYCIWEVGYFADDTGTAYEEDHLVYPAAAFSVFINSDSDHDWKKIIKECKRNKVLALHVTAVPQQIIDKRRYSYGTEDAYSYINELKMMHEKNELKLKEYRFCFKKPAYTRTTGDNEELHGYAPDEIV